MDTPDLLDFHGFCLTNTGTRLDRYASAIRASVRPGDVVLDLGAGTGILSFLACRAGARRVFAVEAGESAVYGRRLASSAGFDDRVEFLDAPSFEVTLPEPVDVIVADVHSTFGLQEQGLSALIDARDRFLKPGGRMVPRAVDTYVAPVEAPLEYADKVDRWKSVVQGVDLAPLREFAVNCVHGSRCSADQLLAPPQVFASVPLDRASSLHVGGSSTSRAVRAGTLHGVCGSFRTTLMDGVDLKNHAGDNASTNFALAFLPIETPVAVAEGDLISIAVDMFDATEFRWIVEVTGSAGARVRFEHATFRGHPLSSDALRKQSGNYKPTLTPRGTVERALLDQFDGTRTAGELESWMASRFDGVLGPGRTADRLLKSTIERCG